MTAPGVKDTSRLEHPASCPGRPGLDLLAPRAHCGLFSPRPPGHSFPTDGACRGRRSRRKETIVTTPTHTSDHGGCPRPVRSRPRLSSPREAPEGQMTWAVHFSLAPTWFDPAETPGIITPFMILYALHDALVKPMPGNPMAPSLAESWTVVARRPHLRFRPAPGREVPQRRARHRRRREVLVRALPGHGGSAQGHGGRGRAAGSAAASGSGSSSRGPTS